jgi:integrase/recombinase XerD
MPMFTMREDTLDEVSYGAWRDYERWAEMNGRRATTLRAYGTALRQLHVHAGRTPILDITRDQAAAFIGHLARNFTRGTQLCYDGGLRSWYGWAARSPEDPKGGGGYLDASPMLGIPRPREAETRPRVLSEDEMRSMAAAWESAAARAENRFLAARNAAMIRVLATFGTPRVAELESFDVADADLRLDVLRIRDGKGGISRDIPFSAATGRALTRYLAARRGAPGCALFVGRRGDRLSVQGIRKAVYASAERAGIADDAGEHVHPHTFRHSTWDMWLRAGGTVHDGKRLWGWTSDLMPARYARKTQVVRAVDAGRAMLARGAGI